MENDAPVVGPDALTANFKMNKLDTATAHTGIGQVLLAHHPFRVDAKRGDHFLEADLSVPIWRASQKPVSG